MQFAIKLYYDHHLFEVSCRIHKALQNSEHVQRWARLGALPAMEPFPITTRNPTQPKRQTQRRRCLALLSFSRDTILICNNRTANSSNCGRHSRWRRAWVYPESSQEGAPATNKTQSHAPLGPLLSRAVRPTGLGSYGTLSLRSAYQSEVSFTCWGDDNPLPWHKPTTEQHTSRHATRPANMIQLYEYSQRRRHWSRAYHQKCLLEEWKPEPRHTGF